ncbi:unnamed protein product [Cyclocybe aegerita]|uniref:F-box domain-containing protein n=1 Tax=Cyclocybe aegerita TaxID=1973307 RepID=A0A8S0WKK8_CYCAE|nr:unnamed protein product [Cyclocybe aegerita]
MGLSQQLGNNSKQQFVAILETRKVSFSDVDVAAVHRTISEHERAIHRLDTETESLMRSIRQLQHRRQQHIADIRRCKGMITLARRLPPELLASIFEECVKDGWTRTPLTVSHVCSSWRKAASIPTVWSHIYVNLDARDPCKRTRLWLEKSEDTLLTINLEVGNDSSYLDSVMELLTKEIRRWKLLTINSIMLHPVNQILQTWNKLAPQLSVVDIAVAQEFNVNTDDADSDHHELTALRTAFAGGPQLRSLRIDRNLLPGRGIIPASISHLTLRLPCHCIPITRQSLSSVIDVLGELTALETLAIEVPHGHNQVFEIDVAHGHAVEIATLQLISLTGSKDIFRLLPHLRLPTLTHLHLHSSLDNQEEDIGSCVVQFLTSSSPPLSFLEIRDLALESNVYDRIFRALPLLERLHLHDCDILDTTLQQLNGPHGLCPFLRTLDLRWCGRLSGRTLVDLVPSRLCEEIDDIDSAAVCRSITDIAVINCSFVKEEDIMNLAKMTICRLIHGGSDDLCYALGCCANERYRKRLRQRILFRGPIKAHPHRRLIL